MKRLTLIAILFAIAGGVDKSSASVGPARTADSHLVMQSAREVIHAVAFGRLKSCRRTTDVRIVCKVSYDLPEAKPFVCEWAVSLRHTRGIFARGIRCATAWEES